MTLDYCGTQLYILTLSVSYTSDRAWHGVIYNVTYGIYEGVKMHIAIYSIGLYQLIPKQINN